LPEGIDFSSLFFLPPSTLHCPTAAHLTLLSSYPHFASPGLTSPKFTSPKFTSPGLTSSKLNSSNLTSPHLTSPHLISGYVNLASQQGQDGSLLCGSVACAACMQRQLTSSSLPLLGQRYSRMHCCLSLQPCTLPVFGSHHRSQLTITEKSTNTKHDVFRNT